MMGVLAERRSTRSIYLDPRCLSLSPDLGKVVCFLFTINTCLKYHYKYTASCVFVIYTYCSTNMKCSTLLERRDA